MRSSRRVVSATLCYVCSGGGGISRSGSSKGGCVFLSSYLDSVHGGTHELVYDLGAAANGVEIEANPFLGPLEAFLLLLLDAVDLRRALRLSVVGDGLDAVHSAVERLHMLGDFVGPVRVAREEGVPEVVEEFGRGGVRQGDAFEEGGG